MDTLIASPALRLLCFSGALALTSPVIAQTVTLPNQTLLSVSEPALNDLGEPISVAKSGQIQTADGKYPIGRADLQFTLNPQSPTSVMVEGQTVTPGQTITIPRWNFSTNNNGYELAIYALQKGLTGEVTYSISIPNAYVSDDPEARVPEKILEFNFMSEKITINDKTYIGFAVSSDETKTANNFGDLNYLKYLDDKGNWKTLNSTDPDFFPNADRAVNKDKVSHPAYPYSFGMYHEWYNFMGTRKGHVLISSVTPTKVELSINEGPPIEVEMGSYIDSKLQQGDLVTVSVWSGMDHNIEQRHLSYTNLSLGGGYEITEDIGSYNLADTPEVMATYLSYEEFNVSDFVETIEEPSSNFIPHRQIAPNVDLFYQPNSNVSVPTDFPMLVVDKERMVIKAFPKYKETVLDGSCTEGNLQLYAYHRYSSPDWQMFNRFYQYENNWNGSLETAHPTSEEMGRMTNVHVSNELLAKFDPLAYYAERDTNLETVSEMIPNKETIMKFINDSTLEGGGGTKTGISTQPSDFEIVYLAEVKVYAKGEYDGLVLVKACNSGNNVLRPVSGNVVGYKAKFKPFIPL